MVRYAKKKFADPRIILLAADIEEITFAKSFDRCMVYNAFPLRKAHDRRQAHRSSQQKPRGHQPSSHWTVSFGLLHEDGLATLFKRYVDVDVVVSNDEIYVVSGVKQ